MTDRLPPENSSANGQNDERVKRLKQASRLIVTTREKDAPQRPVALHPRDAAQQKKQPI